MQYELHGGVLNGDDDANYDTMQAHTLATLQDNAAILTRLTAAADCSSCITGVEANSTELVIVRSVPEGKVRNART